MHGRGSEQHASSAMHTTGKDDSYLIRKCQFLWSSIFYHPPSNIRMNCDLLEYTTGGWALYDSSRFNSINPVLLSSACTTHIIVYSVLRYLGPSGKLSRLVAAFVLCRNQYLLDDVIGRKVHSPAIQTLRSNISGFFPRGLWIERLSRCRFWLTSEADRANSDRAHLFVTDIPNNESNKLHAINMMSNHHSMRAQGK